MRRATIDVAAGRGHIDFRVLAAALRDSGYRGYLSAETLPLPNSRTAARQAIELFQRSELAPTCSVRL